MTARELCNYLVAVANKDYTIGSCAPERVGNNVKFSKFISGTQIFDSSTTVCFGMYGATCGDIVRFITMHNLEDYAIVSCVRLWRVVNYMDISVDPIKKEVIFR